MRKNVDWDARIGRRIRLHELHVLLAVVHHGSMAKAARATGLSQPAVSQMISSLEHALGVRLLDRSARGIEPTIYGKTLMRRGRSAFDELRQGIQEIEFLTTPAVGEVRIAAPESVCAEVLPAIIDRFTQQYPRVVLDIDTLIASHSIPQLRERSLDLLLTRGGPTPAELDRAQDLKVETLFEDRLIVVAGIHSTWARRRKLNLRDLVHARWLLPPSGPPAEFVAEAFRLQGLEMPRISVKSFSVHLRVGLLAAGPYVTALPKAVVDLWNGRTAVKALPVELPVPPWPVRLVTIKNRTLSPPVERFIECAREVTKSLGAVLPPQVRDL